MILVQNISLSWFEIIRGHCRLIGIYETATGIDRGRRNVNRLSATASRSTWGGSVPSVSTIAVIGQVGGPSRSSAKGFGLIDLT